MNLPESPSSDIGAFLRHVRTTLELNLRDAARIGGINFTYLGQVERGERAPSASWLHSYMEHLAAYMADDHASAA